jgi:hypothetical protein
MAFEAEITQSIRELQNAVAALGNKTKEANAGLRQANQSTRELATSTGAAVAATRQHEQQMRQLGKVANETGGAGGRMVKEFMEMGSFAPTALAAGGAIGIVATAVAGLTAEFQRAAAAQREIIRLSGEIDKEARAAGTAAVLGMDVPGQKARALAETLAIPTGNLSVEQIASEAERIGGTTRAEAMQRITAASGRGGVGAASGGVAQPTQQDLYEIATGRPGSTISEDQRQFTADRSRRSQIASRAGQIQTQSANAKDSMALDAADARMGGPGGATNEALRANTKATGQLIDELKKQLEGTRSFWGQLANPNSRAEGIALEERINTLQAQQVAYQAYINGSLQ